MKSVPGSGREEQSSFKSRFCETLFQFQPSEANNVFFSGFERVEVFFFLTYSNFFLISHFSIASSSSSYFRCVPEQVSVPGPGTRSWLHIWIKIKNLLQKLESWVFMTPAPYNNQRFHRRRALVLSDTQLLRLTSQRIARTHNKAWLSPARDFVLSFCGLFGSKKPETPTVMRKLKCEKADSFSQWLKMTCNNASKTNLLL